MSKVHVRPGFRSVRVWLVVPAVAGAIFCGGCQPPAESGGGPAEPPARPSKSSPPPPSSPSPLVRPTAKKGQPEGIVFEPCDAVCYADNASVKGTIFLNISPSDLPDVTVNIFKIPHPSTPVNTDPIKAKKALANKYEFTIDNSVTGLNGKFLQVGNYSVVAKVHTSSGDDTYCAATLTVENCSNGIHTMRVAVQDVPASSTPLPGSIMSVNQSGAQIAVSLSGGASTDDTIDVAFYKASDMSSLSGGGSFTILAGYSSGAYDIPVMNGPLTTAQAVVAVSTVRSNGNSTSCSFTVQ